MGTSGKSLKDTLISWVVTGIIGLVMLFLAIQVLVLMGMGDT